MLKTIPLLIILSVILSGCLKVPTPPPAPKRTGNQPPAQSQPPCLTENQPPAQSPPPILEENPNATVGKHALLIGIENYNHPKISNLKGAINDVKIMKGILRDRFDFQEQDFIIRLNNQATHTGIEKAFQTLIKRVQPNDFVYIHYAGHGSQTPDLNGDERSCLDQTWVAFRSRQPGRENHKDNYDVLDDEINAWLAAIYAKTSQVVFVSDSCHSATVARGKEVPVSRGLQKDKRPHLLGKMCYTKLEQYHGIHIGAARDDEFAAEILGKDGKYYGIFTWHWAKALQQAQKGDTWNDLFKKAHTPVVSKRGEAQRPQLEGERYREVFGGQKITAPVATIPVSNVQGDLVTIQAGATTNVSKGSIYRLHQQNPARLEITKVGTFKSTGKTTAVGAFKIGNLVVEESHAYHFAPIKVYLSADYPKKDRQLLQAIRAAFQPTYAVQLPGYVLTNNPNNIDLRLHLLRPKRQNGQPIRTTVNDALPKSFPNQPPELWILTPDQHLLHNKLQLQFSDPTKGLKLLQHNLNQWLRLREIKALQSSGANRPVTVQIEHRRPVKTCPTGKDCIQLHDLGRYETIRTYRLPEIGKKQHLRKNDVLTFTLHNKSAHNYYYCYLINITPDGSIKAIFPNPEEGMEYAVVKPGEKRALIEEVVLILKKLGEQTIKLLATNRPIDVSLLQQDGFKGRTQDELNLLERLLVSAMHGQRGQVLRVSNDKWFTKQVTFEVK
jgi:hypothetical protein